MQGKLLALVAALALVPALQAATAAPTGTLYLSGTLLAGAQVAPGSASSDAPCDSPDPHYALVAAAPAAGKAYTGRSGAALACSTYFDLTAAAPFTLGSDLSFSVSVGCDAPTASPSATIPGVGSTTELRVQLFQNDKQVGKDANYVPATPGPCVPGTPIVFSGSVTATGTAFAKGDLLEVVVIPFMATTSAFDEKPNLHVLVGPSLIQAVGLPAGATGAAGVVHHATVGDATFHQVFTPANATSDTYAYNWTAGPDGVNVTYAGTVVNGTATLTVRDGQGTVLEAVTLSASGAGARDFPAAKAGTYNVTVAFTAFKGNLTVGLKPIGGSPSGSSSASASGSGTPTATGGPAATTSGASGTSGNRSASAASSSTTSKGSPGIGLVALLAAVGAVLAVRRRLA